MHRGFATAYHYFQPEVIFFLGDVFDEGKWSGAKEFKESNKRFHELFPIDNSRSKGKRKFDLPYHFIRLIVFDFNLKGEYNPSISNFVPNSVCSGWKS